MLPPKKILQVSTVALLLLFVGCESNEYKQEPEDVIYAFHVEQTQIVESYDYTESTEHESNGYPPSDGITAAPASYINFTSTWAKTSTCFFFPHSYFTVYYDTDGERVHQTYHVLYRLPLNNIEQREQVAVPGYGEIRIVGINEQYLFVSRSCDHWNLQQHEVYRISLATLQTTFIDSGTFFGPPLFHPASNSILFAHTDFDFDYINSNTSVRLDSMQLDTGVRSAIFEFESYNFDSGTGWWQLENDAVIFINSRWGAKEWGSDFILINSELQAAVIEYEQINWTPAIFEVATPEFIRELGGVWRSKHVIVDDWVYYLYHRDWMHHYLYRIRLDGTENTLLQENTNIVSLLSVNNQLFATVYTEPGYDSDWHEAVKLSPDGNVTQVLGRGLHGHNVAFGIDRLTTTDIVMIMGFNFFTVDGRVLGLYCTTTGHLFNI